MVGDLRGKRIAVLATDGFEQSELTEPIRALRQAGAKVEVVSPKGDHIQGMQHHEKGDKVAVDRTLEEVRPEEYSGLVLPGGVANPDALRMDSRAVAFVRAFFDQKKPVAAICHGPWMLAEAGVLANRTVTSWPSLKPHERRRDLGRPRGRRRQGIAHQPKTRGPSRILQKDHRALWRSSCGMIRKPWTAQNPAPPEPPAHPPGEPEPEFPPPGVPEPEIPPPMRPPRSTPPPGP